MHNNQDLIDALRTTAEVVTEEITAKDTLLGEKAQRKLDALGDDPSLQTMITVADDIALIHKHAFSEVRTYARRLLEEDRAHLLWHEANDLFQAAEEGKDLSGFASRVVSEAARLSLRGKGVYSAVAYDRVDAEVARRVKDGDITIG